MTIATGSSDAKGVLTLSAVMQLNMICFRNQKPTARSASIQDANGPNHHANANRFEPERTHFSRTPKLQTRTNAQPPSNNRFGAAAHSVPVLNGDDLKHDQERSMPDVGREERIEVTPVSTTHHVSTAQSRGMLSKTQLHSWTSRDLGAAAHQSRQLTWAYQP